MRTALAAYLRECGYDVVEAGTTKEAIQALRLDMKFDLAFLDIEGDAGAGFQLARNSASRGRRSAGPTTIGRWNGTSADCSRGDPQMWLRPRGAH